MEHRRRYESNTESFYRLSDVPENATLKNCRIPRRSLSCNQKNGIRPLFSLKKTDNRYNSLPGPNTRFALAQTRIFKPTCHQRSTQDAYSSMDSANSAAFHQPSQKIRRRHTLSDVQKAIMHCNRTADEVIDSELAPSYDSTSLERNSRVGTISQEEAERKRVAFLHYLEHHFFRQDSIGMKTSQKNTSRSQSRSSFIGDVALCASSSEYEPSAGESFSRGGRLRTSLPIVRSRSRSREKPLGVIYLEYSGESRAVLLPNELTSLDTIRALFVQAYPGLLTMPMLNPQRHTLLLKNKKNGNLEEIDNISRIKDRSAVRARPTGIPTPNNKKPAVQQKPKVDRNNQNRVEDRNVAENNQKNQQKSGLKVPVKSLVRQYQNSSSKSPEHKTAVDSTNQKGIPKSNEASQRSLKTKAPPPPPPRTPKPTPVATTAASKADPNAQTPNSHNPSHHGGTSYPHKGFSYVSSGFTPKIEAKETSERNLKLPSNLSTSTESNKERSPFRNHAKNLGSDSAHNSSKSPLMQPRTYAGSSMASQTQFSTVSQGEHNIPKLLKPKSYEHRSKSIGSNPTSPTSTVSSASIESVKTQQLVSERKETAPVSAPSLYSRASRSFKGNQPKPFAIPEVPDLSSLCISNNTNLAFQTAEKTISEASKRLSSPVSTGSQISVALTSSDGSLEKNKTNNSKKGLFGFRKLVSSKNVANNKQNSKRIQSEEAASTELPDAQNSSREAAPFPVSSQYDTSVRSSSLLESTSSDEFPRLPWKNGVKPSNALSKKASIPKTDLLHSLLNHKSDPSKVANENRNSHSPSSSLYSDSDREASTGPSGLTGVLKNNNLVKSTSASSILTDSGASNLSATPSVKMKKVSFQDNVTVCDGNSISTFSNNLRHPEFDDRVSVGGFGGQSLSHDVTESESLSRECAIVRPWQATTQSTAFVEESSVIAVSPTSYISYQSNIYPHSYTSYGTHQSAVAAAIETITAGTAVSSQYKPTPSVSEDHTRFEQFGVSCASPVPHITRQERTGSARKEEWNPPRRYADPNIPLGVAFVQNRPCITPDPVVSHGSKKMIENSHVSENLKETEIPYLQTQKQLSNRDPDTPPYYECCAPSPPTHSVTPTELHEALDKRRENLEQLPAGVTRSLPKTPTVTQNVPQVASKPEKSNNRMVAMEHQLANLTGIVNSGITPDTKSFLPSSGDTQYPCRTTSSAAAPYSVIAKLKHPELTNQLLQLRNSAKNLKEEIDDLKKQQRCNMEYMNEMISQKAKDVAVFIASTAGAEQRPLRLRRTRLDQQRHTYGKSASSTEKLLSDVEAGVEELRNEVVERRCRVNAREVEALVLQLSQAGRTVAHLKGYKDSAFCSVD